MASKKSKAGRRPATSEASLGARKGIVVRADGREVRRLMTYLPPDLADRLERFAFESGRRQLADVIAEAVEEYLDDKKFK